MDADLTTAERRLLSADDRKIGIFGVLLMTSVGLIAAAGLVLAVQAFNWLRAGFWQPVTAGDALRWADVVPPSVPWLGVERILTWLWSCPLSGVLFFTGAALATVSMWSDNRVASEGVVAARMKRAQLSLLLSPSK